MSQTLFVQRDGAPLAYDDRGTGPLVLCVPSMGDLRQEYRFLAPRLVESGYRVVTADLRGLGESGVGGADYSVAGIGRDLEALLDHLAAGPALVVADSMGAGAAVYLAAERPDAVAGLILMGPFVRGEPSMVRNMLFGTLFGGFWGPSVWTAYYASLYPTKPPSDLGDYRARLAANLREKGRMRALRAMIYASKGESERRAASVAAPVLVLMGEKDPDFKDPEAEARWVAGATGGTYRMIPEAGHYPHAEFPDLVAAAILEFFAETKAGERHAAQGSH